MKNTLQLMTNIFFLVLKLIFFIKSIDSKDCVPRASVTNCNHDNDESEYWFWKRQKTYKLTPDVTKGCESSSITFRWTLVKIGESEAIAFTTQGSLYIEKFTLEHGVYMAQLLITEITKNRVHKFEIIFDVSFQRHLKKIFVV